MNHEKVQLDEYGVEWCWLLHLRLILLRREAEALIEGKGPGK